MAAVEKNKFFPNPVGNCPTMLSSICSDFNSLTGNTAKLSLGAPEVVHELNVLCNIGHIVRDFTTM